MWLAFLSILFTIIQIKELYQDVPLKLLLEKHEMHSHLENLIGVIEPIYDDTWWQCVHSNYTVGIWVSRELILGPWVGGWLDGLKNEVKCGQGHGHMQGRWANAAVLGCRTNQIQFDCNISWWHFASGMGNWPVSVISWLRSPWSSWMWQCQYGLWEKLP